MTRGFITLATGQQKYYDMALNMLKSFRIHNPGVPFAIVCDRQNDVTAQFDDVIVLADANGDYRDKFSLLVSTPYDETIFIEPDCLIYRNLDFFWNLLCGDSDFSCFGWNNGGAQAWFKTEAEQERLMEIIPGLNEIADVPLFNPGYFFIRKGDGCKKMYEDCLRIAEMISSDKTFSDNSHILCNGKLRDDPILDVSMYINGFICNAVPEKGKCIAVPSKYTYNKIDAINGILNVTDKRGKVFENCALLHFSTRRAMEEGLYLWQTIIFNLAYKKSNIYKFFDNKLFYGACCFYRYIKTRVKRVLRALFK